MSGNRPTLAQVARHSGVSVSTASLAFSQGGRITPETRERVLAAAKDLGYSGPNPLGRQLRSGKCGIIGVVLGANPGRAFSDPVAVQVLDGLVTDLGEAGLGALFIPGLAGDSLVASAPMDAAILVWGAIEDDPNLPMLQRRNIPIAVGEGPQIPGTSLVGVEDQAGMRAAVQHLVDLGHTRIAEVTLALRMHDENATGEFVPEDLVTGTTRASAGHRAAGFREVIQPVVTWEAPGSTVEGGRVAAHAILDLPADQRPTAIVAQSDMLAAGVILGLRDRGLTPGEDISVVGFDGIDLPWLAPWVLTSVRQPLREKGENLAKAVLNLIDGGAPTEVYLPAELVIGNTTAPPKTQPPVDPDTFGWSW